MNSPFGWILTFFILLFLYTKFIGPIPFSVTSVTTQKTDAFAVSGEGKATAIPDLAVVNVGVQAQGSTVKLAQDQLNASINKVSTAIKNLGIDSKDIQTTNYSINPTYDFGEGQKITGYTASSNLSIKIRQTDKANSVIDVATANGANQIGGVSFEVSERSEYENQAREKAVSDARKKAEDAAKIAGFKIGKIINYSESFEGGPISIPLRVAAEADKVGETQLQPGSTEIHITVTLSYEII